MGKEEEHSEKDIQSEKEAGEGADHVCVDSNGRLRKDMEEATIQHESILTGLKKKQGDAIGEMNEVNVQMGNSFV